MIRRISGAFLPILLISFVSAAVQAEETHLFVLSGQSNMNGLKLEQSFTPTVTKHFGADNVIVVKDSHGGQPIRRWDKNWKPEGNDNPDHIGDLYERLMTKVRAATKGKHFDTVTFLWMQGERDARERHAGVYAASFNRVLDQLRADLKHGEINFVVGRLSDFGLQNKDYPDWNKMREVLVELADASPSGAWVDTDDLNDGLSRGGKEIKNDLHYSAEGYVTFGSRMAEAAIKLIEPASTPQPPYDVVPVANPPYYRVRYEGSEEPGQLRFAVKYTVWIPPNVETLRGVVVHQHGCGEGSCKSGLTGAFDLHWQALAKKHDCALLAASYEQPQEAGCHLWCDPRNGSAEAFQKSLVDLGEQSGHAELATVPWALWGHSGGGVWVGTMTLLHPDRVAAAWLRSGAPILTPLPDRPTAQTIELPQQPLDVPMILNPGTQEGVTVKEGRFAMVWPRMKELFLPLRANGTPIGVAVDPLTGHACGNQRYLAIPWFDACLSARLPSSSGEAMNKMPAEGVWLAPLLGAEASAAREFNGDKNKAIWLPNESVAKAWMQYTKDTAITDTTPPPAPTHVQVNDGVVTWNAQADLESGISHFIIRRDGEKIATAAAAKNPHGRNIFQGQQFSDTPAQPLIPMRFQDTTAKSDQSHKYEVISVNTVGLESQSQ